VVGPRPVQNGLGVAMATGTLKKHYSTNRLPSYYPPIPRAMNAPPILVGPPFSLSRAHRLPVTALDLCGGRPRFLHSSVSLGLPDKKAKVEKAVDSVKEKKKKLEEKLKGAAETKSQVC